MISTIIDVFVTAIASYRFCFSGFYHYYFFRAILILYVISVSVCVYMFTV